MSSLRDWFEATRPKTLPAALCPVLIGSALAHNDGGFDWPAALLCLLFAGFMQVGTNFANDYLDGVKGTDTDKRLGPRRAVATGRISAGNMRKATIGVLLTGFCIGLGLIPFGGWYLLLVGVASVACAWLYTGGPYPFAYNGLGDVFVVLFFGFIAVGFTYYVQAKAISFESITLGLACGLVINNILVINNYRDREEDRLANKRTLVVLLGPKYAQAQFILSYMISGTVLVWIAMHTGQMWLFLALVPLAVGLRLGFSLDRLSGAAEFGRALALAAKVVAWFGILVAAGLLL